MCAVTVPVVAIPNPALIREPLDAVRAAITTFISGKYGVSAVDDHVPGDVGVFIDNAIAFIEEGNEEFAEAMAQASHELADELGDGGVNLSFILAMSMAAEAGVYSSRGDIESAWRRASFAGILFGVLAGAAIDDHGSLRGIMAALSEKGVAARHAKTRELKAFAVARYREKRWASANDAANKLKDEVTAEGKRIGAVLSDSNAQRTIAEWFRAAESGTK